MTNKEPSGPYPYRNNDSQRKYNNLRFMEDAETNVDNDYDNSFIQSMSHYDDRNNDNYEHDEDEEPEVEEQDEETYYEHPSDIKNDQEVSALLAFSGSKNYQSNNNKASERDVKTDKQRVCFVFFKNGECKDGSNCLYSHDRVVLEKHYFDSKLKLEQSPFAVKTAKIAPGRYSLLQRQPEPVDNTDRNTVPGKRGSNQSSNKV